MDQILISVQESLNRTIEETLYQKLLATGYIPNRETYLGNPAAYRAKQADIASRKGFCVDLFGHGSPADRDTEYVPRIVITGLGFFSGTLGNDKTPDYLKNPDGSFTKILGPLRSSIYRFEVRLISRRTSEDNFLEAIRSNALPNLNYLNIWDSTDHCLVQYGQLRNEPDYSFGLIQKIYTYEIVDVFETMTETIGKVSKIKRIIVEEQSNTESPEPFIDIP